MTRILRICITENAWRRQIQTIYNQAFSNRIHLHCKKRVRFKITVEKAVVVNSIKATKRCRRKYKKGFSTKTARWRRGLKSLFTPLLKPLLKVVRRPHWSLPIRAGHLLENRMADKKDDLCLHLGHFYEREAYVSKIPKQASEFRHAGQSASRFAFPSTNEWDIGGNSAFCLVRWCTLPNPKNGSRQAPNCKARVLAQLAVPWGFFDPWQWRRGGAGEIIAEMELLL